MKNVFIAILFVLSLGFSANAQLNFQDSAIAMPWVSIQYGFNLTGADLAQRHGHFNHIGFFAGYKTERNWVYGVDGSFMFGNDVTPNTATMFAHLADDKGFITDQNGDQAVVVTASRGMNVNGNVGKVIPIFNSNPNSGLYASVGFGWIAHKIRVETQDHVVPVIELDYRKGYDRLVQGFTTNQFIGYAFMSNQSFLKFYGGVYIQEGLTYERRTVFFDEPEYEVPTDARLDLQFGLRLGWMIPIYPRQPQDFYFD
ncbi:MAG: hypothetical protein NXI10_07425 [bacterium]|nr:hypothetical protein [bacterium]